MIRLPVITSLLELRAFAVLPARQLIPPWRGSLFLCQFLKFWRGAVSSDIRVGSTTGEFSESRCRRFSKGFIEVSTELLQLLIKSVNEVKQTLSSIDDRLRNVEKTLAENKGRHSELVTAKDIFVVICGIAAVIVSFIRLTQK